MEYLVEMSAGIHLTGGTTEWNIPTGPSTYISVNGKAWPKTKPITGADINNAYRRLAYLDNCHLDCKCVFNVVEV